MMAISICIAWRFLYGLTYYGLSSAEKKQWQAAQMIEQSKKAFSLLISLHHLRLARCLLQVIVCMEKKTQWFFIQM